MIMKDNIAVIASNVGGIKVGSSNTKGVYVGDKLVAENYFDFSQLYNNLSFINKETSLQEDSVFFLIANFSNSNLTLKRQGNTTTIKAKSIDYFFLVTFDLKYTFSLTNADKNIRAILYEVTADKKSKYSFISKVTPNANIFSRTQYSVLTYAMTCIVMDNE